MKKVIIIYENESELEKLKSIPIKYSTLVKNPLPKEKDYHHLEKYVKEVLSLNVNNHILIFLNPHPYLISRVAQELGYLQGLKKCEELLKPQNAYVLIKNKDLKLLNLKTGQITILTNKKEG